MLHFCIKFLKVCKILTFLIIFYFFFILDDSNQHLSNVECNIKCRCGNGESTNCVNDSSLSNSMSYCTTTTNNNTLNTNLNSNGITSNAQVKDQKTTFTIKGSISTSLPVSFNAQNLSSPGRVLKILNKICI